MFHVQYLCKIFTRELQQWSQTISGVTQKEIREIATEIHPHYIDYKMVYPNRVCSTTTLNEEHSNAPMDYGYESRISPGKP